MWVLRHHLGKEGAVAKTIRTPQGWEVWIKVEEENESVTALGFRARIVDRILYGLKLSNDIDGVSYELIGPPERSGTPPAPGRARGGLP